MINDIYPVSGVQAKFSFCPQCLKSNTYFVRVFIDPQSQCSVSITFPTSPVFFFATSKVILISIPAIIAILRDISFFQSLAERFFV